MAYSTFGRDITMHTVIYGVHIRFWPTLFVLSCEKRVPHSEHSLTTAMTQLQELPSHAVASKAFQSKHIRCVAYHIQTNPVCLEPTDIAHCMFLDRLRCSM